MTEHLPQSQSQSPSLLLASASPRRSQLLAQIGLDFAIRPSDIDETPLPGELPEDYVRRLAIDKAGAGQQGTGRNEVVLGADTIVVLDGEIIGKPRDTSHAEAILGSLSGRTHQVVSGVAVLSQGGCMDTVVKTDVSFGEISAELIHHYVVSGEPMDKAGAYGIQGFGAVFVSGITGSYSNVVGLPIRETMALLLRAGVSVLPRRQE